MSDDEQLIKEFKTIRGEILNQVESEISEYLIIYFPDESNSYEWSHSCEMWSTIISNYRRMPDLVEFVDRYDKWRAVFKKSIEIYDKYNICRMNRDSDTLYSSLSMLHSQSFSLIRFLPQLGGKNYYVYIYHILSYFCRICEFTCRGKCSRSP